MISGNRKKLGAPLERPLVWTTILFAAGAWWGVGHAWDRTTFAWAAAAVAALAVIFSMVWTILRINTSKPATVGALAIMALLGAWLGADSIHPPLPADHISRRIITDAPENESFTEDMRSMEQRPKKTASVQTAQKKKPSKKSTKPHKRKSSIKKASKKTKQPVAVTIVSTTESAASTTEVKPKRPRKKKKAWSIATDEMKLAVRESSIATGESFVIAEARQVVTGESILATREAATASVKHKKTISPEKKKAAIKSAKKKTKKPGKKKVTAKKAIPALRESQVSTLEVKIPRVTRKINPATTFQGVIAEAPRRYPDRTSIIVEAESVLDNGQFVPASGKVFINVIKDVPLLGYGDRVMLKIILKRAENYSNPGGFDYERYLAAQGIFARGSVSDGDDIIVLREVPHGREGLREWVEDVRSNVSDWIEKVGGGGASTEVMRALIVGDRWAVPDDTNTLFQRAGVSHLLAVSGLHIGLVAGIVFFMVFALLKSSERVMMAVDVRRVAALLTLGPVFVYMLLAGSRIPTVRSAIMVTVYMLSVALGRDDDLPSAIAAAAFIILLIWPASIVDAGFVLSFGAVIAIAFTMPVIRRMREGHTPEEMEHRWWRIKYWVSSMFIMSVGIVLFTSPFVAWYFNIFVGASPVSNLIFIPLVGNIALPIGLAASAVHPVWSMGGDWLMYLGIRSLDASMWLMKYFAALPGTSTHIPKPTALEIILVIGIAIALAKTIALQGRARKFAGIATMVLVLALASVEAVWYLSPREKETLRVTYLDIGEGNSAVLRTPGGKTMLVDTGGSFGGFDAGERIIGPYLLSERIGRIDALVITHPHRDHIGGLEWMLANFPVGEIWTADIAGREASTDLVKEAAARAGVPVRNLSRESPPFYFGGARVEIWWPLRGAKIADENDASLVMKISLRDVSFLFPGDVSERVHESVFAGVGGKVNVLLAPHHGSRDGVTDYLLGRLKPEWAVISARYSMYTRLPNPAALAILKRAGVKTLRTDEDGALRFDTDGARIDARRWDGSRGWRIVP